MKAFYDGEIFEIIHTNGYVFARVFRHHISGGYFSASQCEHHGKIDDYLYSRLDIIQDIKYSEDDKYIFRRYWPQYSNNTNIWKQTNRPQDDFNYNSNSEGYEPIEINSTGSYWGGLSRSNNGSTYIDGDKRGTDWWYALGTHGAYSGGIPGPNSSIANEVELWVAIDPTLFDEAIEYDGNNLTGDEEFKEHCIIRFEYSGSVKQVVLNPGVYQLECYGARGGNNGGLGGYSKGYFVTTTDKTLYLCVGGVGKNNSGNAVGAGGYNGGGTGGRSYGGYASGAGGGGATHIATTDRGVLSSYSSYRNEVLIVAGGGGGANSWFGSGAGHGGGTSGSNVSARNGAVVQGGTQTTGYAFGQGQSAGTKTSASTGSEGNGGGGGGWYGGYAYMATGANTNCVGAGGSGYIGGVTNYKGLTKSTTAGVNSGNGYAIIIKLSGPPNVIVIEEDDTKYDITASEIYPFGGDEVTIQFIAKSGYTFKSMMLEDISIPASYVYTVPSDYEGQEIHISAEAYTNPHIVVVHDGKVQSYVLSNSNPDIGTAFAITNVTMKEDWYFKNYVVDVNGRVITNLADTILTLPEWDGLTITLTISHDENRAPYYIYYYLVDYEINEFVLTDKDTFHGHEGNTVRKILRQYEGYHVDQRYHAGITTYVDIIVSDKGNITSVYYDANEYKVTVLYGRATKYVCKHTEIITVDYTSFEDPLSEFKEWRWWPKDFTDVPFKDSPSITFKMPAMNLFFEAIEDPYRKNSNIYKNEYPYIPSDITYIMDAMSQSQEYEDDIVQSNHGLVVGDVVYYHDGLYKKALAEISERADAYAIVYRVNTKDSFAIQRAGMSDIQLPWDKTDSVIMYLSDTEPGKLVHYSVIQNKIYIPCAVWTDQGIIINMATGTIGDEYKPYGEIAGLEVDPYSQSELDETVGLVLGGV